MANAVIDKNDFVKKHQEMQAAMTGERPVMPAEMKRMNAYMSNTGEAATKFASMLTKGIDEKAYPVY